MHTTIVISLLSDWHVPAGVGDGYLVDSVLNRDKDGFPFLPGRALKGALRNAAQHLGLCRRDLAQAFCYFWEDREQNNNSEQPYMRISSAHFSNGLKRQLLGHSRRNDLIKDLTVLRSGTAITDEGVSRKGFLYVMECGMQGLDLYATLDVRPFTGVNDAWLEGYFQAVCAAVKSIGSNRSRGFGRCRISFLNSQKAVVLPRTNAFFTKLGAK